MSLSGGPPTSPDARARPAARPPTRRVLFIDDDPQLLSGLGKALRRHRDRWVMVFAESGDAALVEVRSAAFDVVVSDMRMPAMDGATLLANIRDHDPTTIRMILSGFSDRSAIVRALPVAHQFFNKPCDLGELARAIDRGCELRALFRGEALRGAIARLGALPPVPAAYHELTRLLGGSDPQIEAITELVERDPGLRELVLHGAASPLFGDRPAPTVSEAISCIGIEMLCGLVLAQHALALAGGDLPGLPLVELRRRAVLVARGARDRAGGEAAADAFIAGLVHDVGRIIVARALPDAARAIADQPPGAAAQRAVLGASHAEIGAYLLGQWGMPLAVIDATAHHGDDAPATTPVLEALRAARAAVAQLS